MVASALTAFLVSVFVLLLLMLVVQRERRRGRRFFAVGIRGWFDLVVNKVGGWLLRTWSHFVKYILQLHWYYSIHSVLKAILRITVAIYTYFETVFENNRARAKELRKEKKQLSEMNHLHKMAEHKKDTALTPSQQKKLRHQKLEER